MLFLSIANVCGMKRQTGVQGITSALPRHQNPCLWLTPGAASLDQHQPLAVSVTPQLSRANLFSPNHHCSLAQRMTLTPIRDTFPILSTAESSLIYVPDGSEIHLGYPSPGLSEPHRSLPN